MTNIRRSIAIMTLTFSISNLQQSHAAAVEIRRSEVAVTSTYISPLLTEMFEQSLQDRLKNTSIFVVEQELEKLIKLCEGEQKSRTLLNATLLKRNTAFVKSILESLQRESLPDRLRYLNAQDRDGLHSVMIAAGTGDIKALKLLVEAGASLELKNLFGHTAFTMAIIKDHLPIARYLRSVGASITIRDGLGNNVCVIAKTAGCSKELQRWIEVEYHKELNRAAAAAQSAASQTATLRGQSTRTSQARKEKRQEQQILKLLAEIDIKLVPTVQEKHGRTPFIQLTLNALLGKIPFLSYTTLAELLLEQRANINASDKDGATALLYAQNYENVRITQWLIEHGANQEQVRQYRQQEPEFSPEEKEFVAGLVLRAARAKKAEHKNAQ
jgi:ankyrin repeat protein